MFCRHCGTEVKGQYCSNCGNKVDEAVNNTNNVNQVKSNQEEGSSFGWGVLGFFFPLIGFVLFLVFMGDKKKASKASIIGSVVGVVVKVLLVLLAIFVFSYGIGGMADCMDECGYNFEYRNGQCICNDNRLNNF